MPDKWLTVAEAAAALKCHTRTIERRIASGKLQTRRADDGLLQVLLHVPDEPDVGSPAPDQAFETVRELADNQVSLVTGSASALVKFAQDDATRAREELDIIRQEAGRARRSALAAWIVVASLAVGVVIAVGWTASKITQANADVRQLTDYADKMEKEAKLLLAERDNARHDAEAAKLASAEASGKLAAYVEQYKVALEAAERRPATRPSTFMGRIASVLTSE